MHADLSGALGFWLRLAQQQDLRLFGQAFADSGISQLLFSILLIIEATAGCRQADLGAALRIRQPNLVEPIESLIAQGLVSRRPDPRDRRAQILALTPGGEDQLTQLRQAHNRLIDGYRERLGSQGYDQLVGLLQRFLSGGGDPPPPD